MPENSSEERPMGKWVSYRPEIKILDCTIRDGGLMNDHLFDDEIVEGERMRRVFLHGAGRGQDGLPV